MQEVVKLIIGIAVLALAFPIGNLLAHFTKEELKRGQKWFKRIIGVSLVLGLVGLIFRNDALMFSAFFVALVTSRSLKTK